MNNCAPSASSTTNNSDSSSRSRTENNTSSPTTDNGQPSIKKLWTAITKNAARLWRHCRDRYREYQEEEARMKAWRQKRRRWMQDDEDLRYRQQQWLIFRGRNGYPP